MFDRDKWQEIFSTLKANKLRTGLTAAGVFWGIFMLIFMLGMGDGFEKGVLNEFGGRSSNSIYIWPEETSLPYKGMPVGRWIPFTLKDVKALKEHANYIDIMAPRHMNRNSVVIHSTKSANYDVRGEWEGVFEIEALKVTQGRQLNIIDENKHRKVAVIGKTVKEELFGNTNPIGRHINIKNILFQVVGVIKFDGQVGRLQESEETIFIPLSTSMKLFGNNKDISWFVCTIKPEYSAESVEDDIIAFLAQRRKISPDDKQAVGNFNLEKEYRKLSNLFSSIRWFLWIVGIGTLMAGVVSVSNVMLITVKDRTREIGVRKAIGAQPWSIISLVLLESVFITTLSGYIGLLFGTFLIHGIDLLTQGGLDGQLFSTPEVNLSVSIGSLIILVISGLLAGLLPALHAAKINPVEALRSD